MALKLADYKTDVHNDWCPGCGDFGILNAIQMALADMQVPSHRATIFSGIGCSGKTPHFIKTYGIHTLHGRVLPFAQGAKLANPELEVLAVGGDGAEEDRSQRGEDHDLPPGVGRRTKRFEANARREQHRGDGVGVERDVGGGGRRRGGLGRGSSSAVSVSFSSSFFARFCWRIRNRSTADARPCSSRISPIGGPNAMPR